MSYLTNPYMVSPPVAVQCGLYDLQTYSTDDGQDGSYNGWHNITETGKSVSQVKGEWYRTAGISTDIIALKIFESSSEISSTNNTDSYTYNDLGSSGITSKTTVTFDISPAYTLTANTRLVIVGKTGLRTGILSQAIGTFKLTVSYNGGTTWTDSASWDILGCITEG